MRNRTLVAALAAVMGISVVTAWGASLPPYTPPPVPAAQRAPAAADDTSAGYAVGNLWAYNNTVYQALQVAAGQAAWAPVPAAQALPTDAVTSPLACYGNKALNAAWLNGSWIDVAASAGGAVTTVKFVNGQPDVASLAKVLGSGLGYVSAWYDQCGAALNAVQGVAASQPVIRIDITTGGAPSIVFDSAINGSSLAQKYFALPSGVTAAGNADSAVMVGRSFSARRPVAFFQLTNASFPQTFSANTSFTLSGPNAAYTYGGPVSAPVGASMSPAVAGFTSSSSGRAVYWNNGVTSVGPQSANTMAGGYIGAAYQGATQKATGYAEMSALVIYARGLSATDTTNVQASLVRLFNLTPQVGDVLLAVGDSITEGQCNTALQNYPRKELGLLTNTFQLLDTAYYGSTIVGNRIADYPIYDAPNYNPKARNNILTFFAGTNDIAAGATGATTYGYLSQYISLAHATGWRVVVVTMLPRNGLSGPTITEEGSYNSLIRANGGGAYGAAGQWDALADVAADPTMGASGAPSNTSLYCDGTHPVDLGYSYIAPIIVRAVTSVTR